MAEIKMDCKSNELNWVVVGRKVSFIDNKHNTWDDIITGPISAGLASWGSAAFAPALPSAGASVVRGTIA